MKQSLQFACLFTHLAALFGSVANTHAQPICNSNLWFNGDFETTNNHVASGWNTDCLPTYAPILTQWGAHPYITNHTPGGSNFIWLDHKLTSCINSPSGSDIPFLSQTIPTVPGYTYTFGMWTWAFCQPDDFGTIGLAINGALCASFDAVQTCPPGWVYLSCEYVATSNSTVFTVMDVGYEQQGWDFAVDDIEVVATGATLPPEIIQKCVGDCAILNMFAGGSNYNWSPSTGLNNPSSPTPQTCVSETTIYDVSFVNSGGCPITSQVAVEIFDSPAAFITGQDIICPAEQILLESGVSGTGPFQYQWSNGTKLETLSVSSPGTYSLTLTDANGCESASASFTVSAAPQFEAYIEPYPGVICPGESAELFVNAYDPGPFTYLWNNGTTEYSLTTSTPGTYSVTVTNSKGCSGVASFAVTTSPFFAPFISGQTTFCQGDSSILTVNVSGQGSFTYLWNTGDTSKSIAATLAGQYTVTVANQSGCTRTVSATTSFAPAPQPVLTGSAGLCQGDSAILEVSVAGQGPFNYTWSNGQTGTSIEVTAPGNYAVTVTSPVNTCQGVAARNIADWQVNLQLAGQTAICTGDTTTLTAIGSFSAYAWNTDPPSDQPSISVSLPGTYILSAVDSNGCVAVDSLLLTTFPVDSTFLVAQTCAAANAGVFFNPLQNQFGCDSIVVTTVTLLPDSDTVLYSTTCNAAQAGIFVNTINNQFGCDSTVTTIVTFVAPDTTLLTATTCDSMSAGIFVNILINQSGCDSTVITNVAFVLADTTFLSATTCNPSAVGTFTGQFTTAAGCDSFVVTTVTLLPSSATALSALTCNPAAAGVFFDTLSNQYGCDSLVTTTVTFAPLDTLFLSYATCHPDSAGVFTRHFVSASNCDSVVVTSVALLPGSETFLTGSTCNPDEAGVFVKVLTNQWGCDSTVTTTIFLLPRDTVLISKTTCDTAAAGVFSEVFVNQFGCDSLVTTSVTWAPGNQIFLFEATCDPDKVGVFIANLTNQYGCDSLVTTTLTFALSDTTWLNATTCDAASTGVFTQYLLASDGCDSVVITTVTLLPGSETFLSANTCNPDEAGVFVNHFVNQFGCDSTVTTTVTWVPGNDIFLETVACEPAEAGVFVNTFVNQFGCDSTVTTTVTLLPSDTTWQNLETCDLNNVGVTVQDLQNQWGCDSTVVTTTTLLPAATCNLTVELSGSAIPCNEKTGILTITVTLGTPPFFYEVSLGDSLFVSGNLIASDTPLLVSDLPTGVYIVRILSANGLVTSESVEIVQFPAPVLTTGITSNFAGYAVSCSNAADGAATVSVQGGSPPYTLYWSNGDTGTGATGLPAGLHSVTVTDAKGCIVSQSLQLTAPPTLLPTFVVNDLDCFDIQEGTIRVNLTGGVPPYSYSLDNGIFQNSNLFEKLSPGAYHLTVEDANGCALSDIAFINAPYPVNVELGDDLSIQLGDEVTLQALVNVPYDSLASIAWSASISPTGTAPECDGCLSLQLVPLVTTTYQITVVANNGCSDSDKLTVRVDRRKDLYVPNVFTPGNDGENNKFFIFAKESTVSKIRALQIFDRWGQAIAVFNDIHPNDPAAGWDGMFRGQPLNPAVFVWFAEIEFVDGTIEVFSGDVTLLR